MHQGQQKGSSVQVNLFVVNRSNKQIIPYVILKSKNEFRAVNKTKINEVEIIGCPGNRYKSTFLDSFFFDTFTTNYFFE